MAHSGMRTTCNRCRHVVDDVATHRACPPCKDEGVSSRSECRGGGYDDYAAAPAAACDQHRHSEEQCENGRHAGHNCHHERARLEEQGGTGGLTSRGCCVLLSPRHLTVTVSETRTCKQILRLLCGNDGRALARDSPVDLPHKVDWQQAQLQMHTFTRPSTQTTLHCIAKGHILTLRVRAQAPVSAWTHGPPLHLHAALNDARCCQYCAKATRTWTASAAWTTPYSSANLLERAVHARTHYHRKQSAGDCSTKS